LLKISLILYWFFEEKRPEAKIEATNLVSFFTH
jgi:hypothetical protein